MINLNQITSYLPHEVSFINNKNNFILPLNGVYDKLQVHSFGNGYFYLTDIKLILRPIHDICKPIMHKEEKFVPFEKIAIYQDFHQLVYNILTGFVEVIVFNQLLEWKFDVYGLIDKGLAIDMNNPELLK